MRAFGKARIMYMLRNITLNITYLYRASNHETQLYYTLSAEFRFCPKPSTFYLCFTASYRQTTASTIRIWRIKWTVPPYKIWLLLMWQLRAIASLLIATRWIMRYVVTPFYLMTSSTLRNMQASLIYNFWCPSKHMCTAGKKCSISISNRSCSVNVQETWS